MAALLASDGRIENSLWGKRVNIKCETETEGVSVAGRLGAYLKAGCETGGLHRL